MKILFLTALFVSASAFAQEATVIDTLLDGRHYALSTQKGEEKCAPQMTVELDLSQTKVMGLGPTALPLEFVNKDESTFKTTGNLVSGGRTATTIDIKAKRNSLKVTESHYREKFIRYLISASSYSIKMKDDGFTYKTVRGECSYLHTY